MNLTSILTDVILITMAALAVEAATELLIDSKILAFIPRAVKSWAYRPHDRLTSFVRLKYWLAELIGCGYCTSVWIALPAAIYLTDMISIKLPYSIKILFLLLVIHRLSNRIHEALELVKRGRILTVDAAVRLVDPQENDNSATVETHEAAGEAQGE